jgi:very-short-patch-repair endonuclease
MARNPENDRRLAAVAARQHGVVTTRQLEVAGLDDNAIAYRVAHGWLQRLHRGVYLVGPAPGPLAHEAAALLACGPTALLSHRSAGALWKLVPAPDGAIEVTVSAKARPRTGIQVRVRDVPAPDTTRRHGLRVTTPARTLVDLAATLPRRESEEALNEALVQRLVAPKGLHAALQRSVSRTGAAQLRAILQDDPAMTRSEAERQLQRLIRRARLPRPRTNVQVAGHEVDCYWPEHGLVVEVDGATYHGTPRAFQRDRRREADLHAAGLRLIRVTRWEIAHEPEAVLVRLAVATAAVPTAARPP